MQQLSLTPDWTAPATPFRHTWEGIVNIDQFRWFVRRDVQDQLRMAHDELGARHVRAVGMFDDEMRVLALDPKSFREKGKQPRLNWQVVDYCIDSLLEIGINPMFTTSFVPGEMASGTQTVFSTKGRVNIPKDWDEWSAFVKKAVRHQIDRYGLSAVRNWYFEVWNEPNLDGFFAGTQDDWHRLWSTTYRAIKDVEPTLRVGGPSTARAEWLAELIEFGRKNGCVPDYLITHVYNNDSEGKPLSPFEGPQEDKTSKSPHFAAGVIRGTRRLMGEMGFGGEIHWNEWGRSWWPHFPDRETANEAAWCVKTMGEVSQLADYFAYWCLSDIYDQVGYGAEAFHGNYGMISLQGLRKPVYHGFELLTRLGEERLPLQSTGTDDLTNAIATRSDHRHSVLVYSYQPAGADATSRLKVEVDVPAGAKPESARLYRVSSSENNVLARWREMGAPDYLKPEQTRTLKEGNRLRPAAPDALTTRREGTTAKISFEMEAPGVSLVEFERE